MASKTIRNFALNVLYIVDELGGMSDYVLIEGQGVTFRTIFEEYNERVGAANALRYDQFKRYVREAWSEGYLKLGGAYLDHDRVTTGIRPEDTIELEQPGARRTITSRWSRLVEVKTSIKKIVDEMDNEAFAFVNQEIQDSFIRHQIDLLRLSGGIQKQITATLDATEKDLAQRIEQSLKNHKGTATLGTKRMQLLDEYIRFLRMNAWTEVNDTWKKNLIELGKAEPKMISNLINAASPVAISFTLPSAASLANITTNNPFEGRILKDWAKNIADADVQRILSQVRIGMINGESSAQIASRVVGTAKMKGSDGVTEISRRNAAAITRTAVMSISNATREQFYEENSDIFEKERYVATLDARTTPVCRGQDGKVYLIGLGPKPPLHFNCRSLRVPYFAEGVLGDRPARNFTKQQLLREFAEAEKIKSVSSRDKLPRGFKGKYDEFARKRMRELTSIVPASTTYQTWLMRQPVKFQEEILGPTKAKLFRDGGLKLDKFVDFNGKELTLAQLQDRYPESFEKAGLNLKPKEYKTFTTEQALKAPWKNTPLSQAEFDAVSGYTSTSYAKINKYWRGIDVDSLSEPAKQRLLKESALISRAISRSAVPSDLKVFRYPIERHDTRSDYAKTIANLKIGSRVIEKSFMSTTLAKDFDFQPWKFKGGVKFEIQVAKGTPAINMMKPDGPGGRYPTSFIDEYEIIFGKGAKMTVIDIVTDPSGGKIYVLRMDPP